MEMFPSATESSKESAYRKAESLGISPFHMYAVLDCREMDSGYKLVRLVNPWAGGEEWKGPCSDLDSGFWTD